MTAESPNAKPITVLMVDDDLELCQLMEQFFAGKEIRLVTAREGRRGLELALGGGHDIILLDVSAVSTPQNHPDRAS
jgi:two-component system response regulator CpxR